MAKEYKIPWYEYMVETHHADDGDIDFAFWLSELLNEKAKEGWNICTHAIYKRNVSPDIHFLTFKRERIN